MVPVQIGNGWGQTYIGFNRRYVETNGAVENFGATNRKSRPRFRSTRPSASFATSTARDGTPLAILVNYACHPVILGPDSFQYSADYPGEMRRVVEHAMGHDPMAFFLRVTRPATSIRSTIKLHSSKTPSSVMKQTGEKCLVARLFA